MATKKKPTRSKPRPLAPGLQTVDARTLVTEQERVVTLLVAIANSLARIEEMMHVAVHRAERLPAEALVGRVGPSTLPGGDQEFISGQWHRRAGDVYANVAEPGTPNAGNIMLGEKHDDDDPSGTV